MTSAELVLEQEKAAPPEGRGVKWGQFELARALVFGVLATVTVWLEPWNVHASTTPTGTRWVVPWLPLIDLAVVVMLGACLLAAVGRYWPVSGWLAVALGVFVLAVPQMDSKVSHYHHVLWLPVVLLLAERGDWVRPARFLIGWVYLVPGLSKLAHFGMLADGGMETTLERVRDMRDNTHWIPAGGAWFPVVSLVVTVLVEVAMLPVLFTRWRRWGLLAGWSFHLSTWWVLAIPFWHLWLFYPLVLCEPRGKQRPAAWTFCAVVVVASLIAWTHAWPFAIYPTFSNGV